MKMTDTLQTKSIVGTTRGEAGTGIGEGITEEVVEMKRTLAKGQKAMEIT